MRPITLVLFFILITSSLIAQEDSRRVIDDKYRMTEQQVRDILEGKISENSDAKLAPAGEDINQFTDDETHEDIELFAAINPTDTSNIIISWMSMDPANTDMPLVFRLYYTNDFGESWQEGDIDFIPTTITPPNEALSGGGDPMIVFDTNGVAYISWIYTVIRVISAEEIYIDWYLTWAKSSDKGATWTRESGDDQYITSGVVEYTLTDGFGDVVEGSLPDKQWMTVNPTNNDIYASLAEFNSTDNYHTGIDTWGVRRKPAGQAGFNPHVLVAPEGTVWAQLGSITADKEGKIHAVFPYYAYGFPEPARERLVHAVSTDDGQTFSEEHFIADVDVTNFQGVGQENTTSTGMYDRLYPASYIAVDTCSTSPYEGRLYVVWNANDPDYTKKVDVWFSYSDDDGQNWSEPKIVHSDPPRNYGFHHRPTIYVNSDGVLVLAWYDNRGYEVPYVFMNDYYFALSYDGGQTFEEYKASPEAFNYNDGNFESSVGVGEYFQVVASKHHTIVFYGAHDGNDTEIYYNILPFGEATNIRSAGNITDKLSAEIYPNPANDFINLSIKNQSASDIKISLSDVTGKELLKQEIRAKNKNIEHRIPVKDLALGTYFVKIQTEEGFVVKQIIKK